MSIGTDSVVGQAPARVTNGWLRRWTRIVRRRLTLEHLAVLLLALLVLLVHDVRYIFSFPYWTDESWVAGSTLFPLPDLPATTSSTPIGWSVLVRIFTVSGTESARVVPLAFACLAVAVSYWFARRLGWRRREVAIGAGVLAAIAMVLVPAMLQRDELKQFTTDACFAMLALAALARLERNWSRGSLAVLSVITWGGMLFSHTVSFVGAAAFTAVCVVQLARRAWRPLAEAIAIGAVTAVLIFGVYEAFDARAVLPGLMYNWHYRTLYMPVHDGLRAAASFAKNRFYSTRIRFGLGPPWMAAPLYAAGVLTVFRLGRPATAVALVILWPEMLLASALHLYPFLDAWTSTFLFALTAVIAAVGVAGMCAVLRPYLKGTLAAGLAALAVAGFAVQARPYIHTHVLPHEDARDQASYVAAHATGNDVILVNLNSNWNFAYYWKSDSPGRRADTALMQQYEVYYPSQPRIVVARDRDSAGVSEALAQALSQSARRGCSAIWLIRTHSGTDEQKYWAAALAQHHLTATRVGSSARDFRLGNGLSVIRPDKSSCG